MAPGKSVVEPIFNGQPLHVADDRVHDERVIEGDAFGQALLACQASGGVPGSASELVERSDGYLEGSDVVKYFALADDWGPTTRFLREQAKGRVLDIGAGAGRVALALQDDGHDVVALDVSEGAAAVCHQRGVRSTFTGSLFDLASARPEPFDSFVMAGNNLGLLGGTEQAVRVLDALVSMARPGARVIGETVNPYGTANPDHLRYQDENRRLGRLPGQLRLRIRRGLLATPWWDYLFCTPTELEAILARTRWALADAYSGAGDDDEGGAWSHGQWTAVLNVRS